MSKLKATKPEAIKPSKPKILIYGPPGVGKTWFSLAFPATFYIDTEGGAARSHYMDRLEKSGGMILGTNQGSLDFDVVLGQLQALATEKHGFKTVVIDSITKLFNTAVAIEAERLGDKDAFGASKKPAIAQMRRLVNWISRLDMSVILIAHQREEWGKDSKGERTQIGDTFDCWDKLAYELDLSLQASKQGSSRKAAVKKSRLIGFPDAERFDLDYDAFSERYGREVIEAEVKPITLATPEQVAEIERLVATIRLDEDTVAKWLTKASAAGWAELTTEQAAGIVNFCNKKINPNT